MPDAIISIAENIARTRLSDLPPGAVWGTKRAILDALGTTIAGSGAAGINPVLQCLRDWGGKGEATIAVFGDKLPAHHAVFANVMMCHAHELDDQHIPAIVHPTAPCLWAALAAAEIQGDVTGGELLVAVSLGIDTVVRMALGASDTLGHGYNPAIYAGFGAAATAGRLLGLDRDTLVHALGLTFSQTGGSVQAAVDGALAKRLQPCFNASAGIKAVQLARAGVSGIQNVMEGKFGFGPLFNRGPVRRDQMLEGLGQRFMSEQLSTKLYPASICAHAPIAGTKELVRQYDIAVEDVAEIVVAVQEGCFKRRGPPFDPLADTAQAKALFSIDYCVAAAVLWRDVFIEHFDAERFLDPCLPSLLKRVKVIENSAPPGNNPYLPVRVEIRLRDGRSLPVEVSNLRGSPQQPLSWDELVDEKLKRCIRASGRNVEAAHVACLVKACHDLEALDDARVLMGSVVFERPEVAVGRFGTKGETS